MSLPARLVALVAAGVGLPLVALALLVASPARPGLVAVVVVSAGVVAVALVATGLARHLERGRGELRRAIHRLGDALSASHDLPAVLDVTLEMCALTLRGDAAVLWLASSPRSRLEAQAAYQAGVVGSRLEAGQGLPGWAASHGHPAVFPGDAAPSPVEPAAATAVAVPVHPGGRLFGVLAVYAGRPRRRFTADDVATLQAMARQMESAVENVFLLEEAQRLSLTDGLTGVWNRRHFDLRAVEALQVAARFHEPFSVVLLDIDHFKQVNDRHGHQAGDAVLVELAGRLTGAVREVDMVARYGGEEFALLLPRTDLPGALKLAEKVLALIAEHTFAVDGSPLSVTASMGVACHPAHGATVKELVAAADVALYRAKAGGRNRVECAGVDQKVVEGSGT